MIYWRDKLVDEAVDRGMDWSPTLAELGDRVIVASSWVVTRGDVTVSNPAFAPTTTATRVRNGEPGEHHVRNTVTLDDGQILQKTAFIEVRSL